MLEIDFSQVKTQPADVPFYADDEAAVRIPLYLAVRCLDEQTCQDCRGADKQRGLIAWIAERADPDKPTHWVTLCEEHFATTTRKKPTIFPQS